MEKLVVVLCLIGATGLASADRSIFDQRLCPDGYYYAGEDTPKNNGTNGTLTGYAFEEKLHETAPYSCYKIVKQENSTQDSFEITFNHVVDACGDDKAKPVALEDMEEANRLAKLMRERGFTGVSSFLTSGVFFADVKQWMWLGSNKSLDNDIYSITGENGDKQCLAASFDLQAGDHFYMTNQSPSFSPVECNKRSDLMTSNEAVNSLMVCEVRAVTVTYLAWFYSNWLTFLLVLMTTMLLVALCLSVFKYKGGRSLYANRRVYRADARTTVQQPRDLPYGDSPPTYSDVTGIVTETQQTKMDKYKNKGKEILAKVTLYKNTTN